VENLSYGLTVCAERTAICNSVTRGERNLVAAFISTDMEFYVSPCGACRQTLHEFGVKHCFLLTNTDKIQYFSTQFLLPSAVSIPHLKDVTKPPTTIKSKKKAQINGNTKSKVHNRKNKKK
jgi:cytidine deaminase